MDLVVTTVSKPGRAELDRAGIVAARCRAELVVRRGSLAATVGDQLAYVVGRHRDELRRGSERLAVHTGMLATRVNTTDHPMIRAIGPCRSVLDATLGLAQDALHIAASLHVDVVGAEASPAVFSLLEEGLPRLATEVPAAARVRPMLGRAEDVDVDVDVIFAAPMFRVPAKAPPGYTLFRDVAVHTPIDLEALRARCRRLVVKVERDAPPPLPGMERLRGKAVDYYVS